MRSVLRIARISVLSALALAIAGPPAAADWLVTTDGSRIETRGPWEVKSNLVVFTTPAGVLSSIRLSACDLPASEAATAAAASRVKPRPSPEPKNRPPVLVLTDKDVGHVRPGAARIDAEEPEESVPAPVVVGEWQATDEPEGVGITGIVRNDGPNVAGNVRVIATFLDAEGDPIENRAATLSASTLAPGRKAQFRVPAFGLFSYSRVEFDVQHFDLLTGRPGADADER